MHPFIKVNEPSNSRQFLLRPIDLVSSQKIFKSQRNRVILDCGNIVGECGTLPVKAPPMIAAPVKAPSKIEDCRRDTWSDRFRSALVGGVSGSCR